MPPRIPRQLARVKHPISLTSGRAFPSRSLRTWRSVLRGKDANSNDETSTRSETSSEPSTSPPQPSISDVLANTTDADNSLLAPVHIPEDPHAILKSDHPARSLLAESGIVVQRQIEMMNVFLGFEQANRYIILDPHGNHIGYMAEFAGDMKKNMGRQLLKTHRPFTTNIFDRTGTEVLRFDRPFSVVNSLISVYDPIGPRSSSQMRSADTSLQSSSDESPVHRLSELQLSEMRIVGQAQAIWELKRRKYDLFLSRHMAAGNFGPATNTNGLHMVKFAAIDAPILSWHFDIKSSSDETMGSINREWRGFGREAFTDTGAYCMRMDAASLVKEIEEQHGSQSLEKRTHNTAIDNPKGPAMTLDQRAVMLATAVSVDYDYFSRGSSTLGNSMFLPYMMMGGAGGEAAAGGAAATEAAGVAVGGAGRAAGGAAVGGMGEGAMVGAGTMAGYEAMQRGIGRDEQSQDQSAAETGGGGGQGMPDSGGQYDPGLNDYQNPQSGMGGDGQGEEVWGDGNDPWQQQQSGGGSSSGGGGDGGEGAGSLLDGVCSVM